MRDTELTYRTHTRPVSLASGLSYLRVCKCEGVGMRWCWKQMVCSLVCVLHLEVLDGREGRAALMD